MTRDAAQRAVERAKIRRLCAANGAAVDEERELNVVPYLDIIVNILIFVLATLALTFTATIDTTPPAIFSRGVGANGLGLTVLVVNEGFALKTSAGNVASGCEGAGAGIAIPKRAGDYDFSALTECVERLKRASPAFEKESQVSVAANPDTSYQTVIRVVDALRSTPRGEQLFPDVSFKVPR
jgi:biopolymer transport protein TolR